uniref:CRC domain-containing protein n=1 Tax=Panagrolaimus superbus TaxID=310955 RepID=A0A914Z4T0_9BILA
MENNILLFDDAKTRYPGRRFSVPLFENNNPYFESPVSSTARREYFFSSPARKYNKTFAKNSTERIRAIKATLDKNPTAFNSKIGVGKKRGNNDIERVHTIGCSCKKSSCMKNYCECYEAKVACSERCSCRTCCNTENDREGLICDKFPMINNEWDKNTTNDEDNFEEDLDETPIVFPWAFITNTEKRDAFQNETIKSVCAEFGNAISLIFDSTLLHERTSNNEILKRQTPNHVVKKEI